MFQKQKTGSSKLFKGSAAALAAAFSLTMFPVGLSSTSADYVDETIGSEAIIVQNINQSAPTTGAYEIRAAYFGDEAKIPVGLEEEQEGINPYAANYFISYGGSQITDITSSVSVTYANSNVPLEITKKSNDEIISGPQSLQKPSEAVYGTVELSSAGEYIVEYTIDITLEGGETKHFSTEYSVFSRISDAYFDFAENDPNVIPSVYDIDLVKAKNNGNLKDLALPLPTVFDENDVEQDVAFLSTNDQAAANGKAYVVISVSGGNNSPIAVEEVNGNFFIPARYFDSQDADTFAGTGNFTIKYSYYTANGQFVTSINKSYRVEQTYYENYSYDLSLTSSQVNAITGVEVELPTLSAATGEDADPSGESVEISYTVTAYRRDANGAYTETRDGSIVDGMFTPWADGDYLIRYDAVDFYGEEKSYNDLYIEGVRDSRAPVVIAYDAGDDANFNDDGSVKEYIDASTKLKSKTRTNNIVIYAVGATDNVSTADKMELTRTVSSSSKTITIGNQYAKYNILFDFSVANLADNHTLLNLLTTAGVDTSDEAAVKTWLNANGYLIATNDESLTIEDGYAYLDVSLTNGYMLNGSQSGITYTVRYRATDAAGNNATSLSYQVNVTSDTSFADAEAPSITFPTSLKNSYRTDAVITFEEPTATDDNDTRMQLVVDYFYTGLSGDPYDPITLDDEYSIDLAEIFGADYSSKGRPVSVTIRVTTEDDYGNDATWTKEIEIADIEDSKVPVLVSEQYSSENPETIQQNSEVILPTLTFTDDNVRYMNAQVYVNRITYTTDSTSDENQVRVESPVVVTGKQELQKSNGIYRVFAGKFVAAYGGDYEAKVVVTDAGGNQITTYYYFHAEGTTYVSDPVIQAPNVIGDEGTIELGTEIEFETPTISYSLAENQGILGVVTDDDSRSATDYFISVINGAPTDYTLDGDVFTARAVGNFTFVYNVKVTVFDNTIFSENEGKLVYKSSNAANGGSVSQLENQDLVILTDGALFYAPLTEASTEMQLYQISGKAGITVSDGVASASVGGKTYKVLITRTGIEFIARDGSTLDLSIADDQVKLGETTEALDAAVGTISSTAIKTYNLVSDPIRATVKDTTAPTMGEYDYPVTANVNETIAIQPITAEDLGGIDRSRSYVQIAYRGSSSRTTTINMSDWTTNDDYNAETGNIDSQLTRDGNYTITYYVYDNQGNLNDDRSYSIAVGDCESPKIDLPSDLVEEKYDLGSTLTLDFDKIKKAISDNVTSTDALLETLEIKLVNTSNNNKEVKNTGNAEENRYSYTLSEAGTYRLEISVRDEAGWETVNDEIEFEVSTDAEGGMNVYEIVGTVLIVVACLVLAGVILYFVISKVKKDKKRKAKGSDTKKSADAKKKDK